MNVLGWTSQPWPMSWMKDKDWKKPSPVKCVVDNIMFSVARTVRHTTDCLTRLCSLQHWMSLRVDETNSYQEWLRCNYPCLEAEGFTGWVLPALFSASVIRICRTGVQAQSCFSPCQWDHQPGFQCYTKYCQPVLITPILWVSMWLLTSPPSHTLSDTVTRGENIKQKMGYSHCVNVTNTLTVTMPWKGYNDLATKDGFTRLIQP